MPFDISRINEDSMINLGWPSDDIEYFFKSVRDGMIVPLTEQVKGCLSLPAVKVITCKDGKITRDITAHFCDICALAEDGEEDSLTMTRPPGGIAIFDPDTPLFPQRRDVVAAWRTVAVHSIEYMQQHGRCGNIGAVMPHAPCGALKDHGVSLKDALELHTPAGVRWLQEKTTVSFFTLPHFRLGRQVNARGALEPSMKRTFLWTPSAKLALAA